MFGSNGTIVIAIKPVSPVTVKMDTHTLTNCDKIRSARSKLEMDTRTHMYHKTRSLVSKAETHNNQPKHPQNIIKSSVMPRVEMDAHTRKTTQTYYNTQEAPHFVCVLTRPHKSKRSP